MKNELKFGITLDFPVAAILAGEPFGVAPAHEGVLGGVPLEAGSMPVAEVHEVAGDGAAGSDAGVADGLLAALHAGDEVGDLVLALVEGDLLVLEEVTFGEGDFAIDGSAGGLLLAVEGVDFFAAEAEGKFATTDIHLALGAVEGAAVTAFRVGEHRTAGVNELSAAFCRLEILGGFHLHGAVFIHAEAPLGDVDVMRAPVGDHAAAEFAGLAPVREGFAFADRAEFVVEGHERGRAAPHVPVEAFGLRFFGVGVRRGGIANTNGDAFDLADDTVANEFAGDAELLAGALHGAGLEHAVVLFDGFDDGDGLVDVVREGLLTIDVLAVAEGAVGDDGVPVVGSGDAHGVDVGALGDLAEVAGGLAGLGGGTVLRVVVVHLLFVKVTAHVIHVTHSDNFDIGILEEFADEAAHLLAEADEAHADLAVGRLRPEAGWKNERRCHRCGGGFDEMTT